MKILIADDNNTVKQIRKVLPKEWNSTLVIANDGEEATKLLETDPPPLAFLNCSLPKIDGIDVCKNIKQRGNIYTYVVLMSEGGAQQLMAGLTQGANEVLLKPVSPKELHQTLSSGLRNHAGTTVHEEDHMDKKYDPLTNRQHEILQLLAEGLSNQEIGARLAISLGTVKSHINHILDKLAVPSRGKALIKAGRLGLI